MRGLIMEKNSKVEKRTNAFQSSFDQLKSHDLADYIIIAYRSCTINF